MNKLSGLLLLLLTTFLLFLETSSFSQVLGNRHNRQLLTSTRPINTEQRQYKTGQIYTRRQVTQSKLIVELRGGSSLDSERVPLRQKWSQFANKNFFLLGMFAAVGLARAFPAVRDCFLSCCFAVSASLQLLSS